MPRIKDEDAGELYSMDPEIRTPDFRVVTVEGREILVEVKNCHTLKPDRDYRFTRAYLDGLKLYAALFQTELFIAIYWSQLNLWTLIAASDFELQGDEYFLSLPDAMKRNNMRILGDCMIGTIPSLTLKFLSDPTKPRTVGPSGQAHFTIGRVELYCGGQLIEDPLEQKIAWFLMNYGKWPGRELPPEVLEGQLISVGFLLEPQGRSNPGELFERGFSARRI